MALVLLIGLFLAAFFALNTMLRGRRDERLHRRVTLMLIAITFAVVGTIIVAIQLGFTGDHYP